MVVVDLKKKKTSVDQLDFPLQTMMQTDKKESMYSLITRTP